MISHRYVQLYPKLLFRVSSKDMFWLKLMPDIHGSGPGSAQHQAEGLQAEGVVVITDSMGEMYVDFTRYGWFPSHLANEESDEE
jgi:hypothetical protein